MQNAKVNYASGCGVRPWRCRCCRRRPADRERADECGAVAYRLGSAQPFGASTTLRLRAYTEASTILRLRSARVHTEASTSLAPICTRAHRGFDVLGSDLHALACTRARAHTHTHALQQNDLRVLENRNPKETQGIAKSGLRFWLRCSPWRSSLLSASPAICNPCWSPSAIRRPCTPTRPDLQSLCSDLSLGDCVLPRFANLKACGVGFTLSAATGRALLSKNACSLPFRLVLSYALRALIGAPIVVFEHITYKLNQPN